MNIIPVHCQFYPKIQSQSEIFSLSSIGSCKFHFPPRQSSFTTFTRVIVRTRSTYSRIQVHVHNSRQSSALRRRHFPTLGVRQHTHRKVRRLKVRSTITELSQTCTRVNSITPRYYSIFLPIPRDGRAIIHTLSPSSNSRSIGAAILNFPLQLLQFYETMQIEFSVTRRRD